MECEVLDERIAAMLVEVIPPWAVGKTNELVIGARLITRDKKRISSGYITEIDTKSFTVLYTIITDVGSIGQLTAIELYDCYFPPQYIADIETVLANLNP